MSHREETHKEFACVRICILAFDPTRVYYVSPPPTSVERQSGKSLTMERINFFFFLVSAFI